MNFWFQRRYCVVDIITAVCFVRALDGLIEGDWVKGVVSLVFFSAALPASLLFGGAWGPSVGDGESDDG